MTMTVFIKKTEIPSKIELETQIEKLGFKLKFPENFDCFDEFDGDCLLDGKKTFFEVYFQTKREILDKFPHLNKDLAEYDSGFSFLWGADFIAGTCISIISLALIELSNSKVVYVDDEIWYDKQMLIDEIPSFLEEDNKRVEAENENKRIDNKKKSEDITIIILWILLVISAGLMRSGLLPWPIPVLLLFYILFKNKIDPIIKRRKQKE